MGREIRKVPPNYVHPVYTDKDAPNPRAVGQDRPLFDQHYDDARREWIDGLAAWEAGTHPDRAIPSEPCEYWEWCGNPPDRAYYRPWKDEEATWFQVWQTVSEGSPVSPPFATEEELIQYLAANGDFWDQNRLKEQAFGFRARTSSGWGEAAARAFVKAGSAPSMMVINNPGERPQIIESHDIPLALEKERKA